MNLISAKSTPIVIPLLVFGMSIAMGMMIGSADRTEKELAAQPHSSIPREAIILSKEPLAYKFVPHEQIFLPQVEGVSTKAVSSPTSAIQPTVTPALYLRCRKDCTIDSCGVELTCMAFANDEGMYTYQCVNPLCAPSQQDDECKCILPSPLVKMKK